MPTLGLLDKIFGIGTEATEIDAAKSPHAIFWALVPAGRPVRINATSGPSLDLIGAIAQRARFKIEAGPDLASRHREKGRKADDEFAGALIQALFAAAKSDCHLDRDALDAAVAAFENTDLTGCEKAFVRNELLRPPMLDHMTSGIATREETVELYAASLLAADPAHKLSRHYLKMLAARLGLEQALTESIESTVADLAATRSE